MSTRFEWMNLPHIEFVPDGYDVREGAVVSDNERSSESTVTGGALLVSGDEVTVIEGDPEGLAEWAVTALAAAVSGADLPLYDKCLTCHLFVEPNSAYDMAEDNSNIARYSHLCNDDYPDDEALDASHEPHPSGVRLPLAVWRTYGPAYMLARFDRPDPS